MAAPTVDARGRNNTNNGASQTHTSTTTDKNNNSNKNNNTNKNNNSSNKNNNTNNNSDKKNNNNAQPVNNNQPTQPVNNDKNNNQSAQPVNNNNNKPNDNKNNNQTAQPVNNNNNNKPNDNKNNNQPAQPVNNNNNKPNDNKNNKNDNNKADKKTTPKASDPVPYIADIPNKHTNERPTAPASNKRYSKSLFSNILGVALGTAINTSVNYLYNAGYSVVGYGDNVVLLNNVTQMGYTWPIATFYYTNGYMESSEFLYATDNYDLTRYNKIYNQLVSSYGAPVSINNTSNTMSTTWWGQGEYITLTFGPEYAKNNDLKYFTRLILGK
jgi:hypothetical protein